MKPMIVRAPITSRPTVGSPKIIPEGSCTSVRALETFRFMPLATFSQPPPRRRHVPGRAYCPRLSSPGFGLQSCELILRLHAQRKRAPPGAGFTRRPASAGWLPARRPPSKMADFGGRVARRRLEARQKLEPPRIIVAEPGRGMHLAALFVDRRESRI